MLKYLIYAFLVVNGARNFQFSLLFFWQNARWTLKSLYLDQIKLFLNSKSILCDYFYDAFLLLTHSQSLFYRLGI